MPELIPLPVLFGNPERVRPSISPDGTQLAWIAPHEGVLNVWLAPVSAAEGVDLAAARVITDDTDRGIRQFGWAHDGRHLLYLQDTGGDENWRLHDVDMQTMERRDLTPFDGVQAQLIAHGAQAARRDPDRPEPRQPAAARRVPARPGDRRADQGGREPGLHRLGRRRAAGGRGGAIGPLPDGGFELLVRDDGRRATGGRC